MSGIQFRSKSKSNKRDPQAGMISILVTMLLLIVISLIVLGFAQISRRNQRQTLDQQLSTQAFYAAESGINDARNLIVNAIAGGTTIPAKPDCTNGSGAEAAFYGALVPTIDAANNVAYTCLIVNPAPDTLSFSDVGMTGTVFPLESDNGVPLSSITLTWKNKANSATPTLGCPASANSVFSNTTSWTCGYGVMRFDLVPTNGTFDAISLQARTFTSFLVPVTGGVGAVGFPAAPANINGNNLIAVHCTNTDCTMKITGLSSDQYYMRLNSIYKDVSLDVSAVDGSGNQLALKNAQALIDATGKAQDVLRRIKVHMPLTASNTNQLSDYAIESTDAICKRFVVMNGYFQSYAASVVPGLTSITTPPNPLCQ